MTVRTAPLVRIGAISVLIFCSAQLALAQLNENCTVSVLNRNVRVDPDGSWVLPNIPANFGAVKARATCVQNGVTTFGESAFFTVPENGAMNLPTIVLGATTPIPSSLSVAPAILSFASPGQTIQLVVTAIYPNNTTKDVTASASGTNYTTSNPSIASVSVNGLVTAVASGTVVIQATNDGASAIRTANVVLSSTDSDHDGIPDDVEIALGMDPHNPVDAQEDFDRDGLTNLQEYQLGTNIRTADTDADGLGDGDEVNLHHTNPLLSDTDGDLIPDGVELTTGTNPLDRNSYDLKKATAGYVLKPTFFTLTTSVLFPNASQQLSWKVNLIDGKTTLDLTADARTNYSSSNLNACNFGATKGQIFAGSPGNCTITISNSTLAVAVSGTVQTFTPTPLSFLDIPGFANNVEVSGNYAYVAAGSTGLQIVDVTDHAHPHIVASRSLPGNANDVVVAGVYAYVAAGNGGLQIVNISNPFAPFVTGSLTTGGVAWDVVVKGSRAYVANGASGLTIIDVSSPPAPSLLGTLSLVGTSKGVDVDAVRQIAAVALGTSGLAIINLATPASPTLLNTLPGGDIRDVALSGNFAFLADFSRSFTSVDLTNPSAPVLRASTPSSTGGLLQDIAVAGSFAAGADVFFVNGVPMIDVSNPTSPQPRTIIDFQNFRDDNGTGIGMDASYVYLTAELETMSENGGTGDTRLYIGQYNNVTDSAGIPPTIQITSPTTGPLIQGSTITISASATDDVAVASVNLLVNGQVVFTDSLPPYQFNYTVPLTATTLTFGAIAVDYGNNIGAAPNVVVPVIPDPLTTARGRVLDSNGVPVAGATVSAFGRSASTVADGTFSLPGLPTAQGPIAIKASATVNGVALSGLSTATLPVAGGITNVGDIRLFPAVPNVTFSEYPVLTANSQPNGITMGPDGNLWFTEARGNKIGKITPAGAITEFPVTTAGSLPFGITTGPDGNLWFTEHNATKIGKITTAGVVTEFSVSTSGTPYWIAAGSDSNLWFTEESGDKIGRITTAGLITEFPLPAGSDPVGITAGPDGNLWFTEQLTVPGTTRIGKISPAGQVTQFSVPTATNAMYAIAAGPDGNLWFTDLGANQIGRITTAGVVTGFPIPTSGSAPVGITPGADGNLWFTEQNANKIGRITPAGVITEFPVPTGGSAPEWITAGPDGNLWFTEFAGNKIVKADITH